MESRECLSQSAMSQHTSPLPTPPPTQTYNFEDTEDEEERHRNGTEDDEENEPTSLSELFDISVQSDSMTTISHPSQSVTLRAVLQATEGQKHVPKMTTRKKITLT